MHILLIAGLWLDGTAWTAVADQLRALGHHPDPLTLPGQGDGSTTATLDDQVAAVLAALDATPGRSVVVGHSAATTLAWLAADARPDKIATVVLIGGFPTTDGKPYFDFLETTGDTLPFPGWATFDGPDSADLDEPARKAIAATAIPVPQGVTTGIVRLTDQRRFDVPVLLICPEFSPAQAKEWINAGEAPELARVKRLQFADIDSGHWPMHTKPAALATLIADAADAANAADKS